MKCAKILALAVAALCCTETRASAEDKLRIVTSLSVYADIAKAVGGDAVEGFMVATHFASDGPLSDSAKHFAAKYKEMFKEEPGAFECLGYDGVRTLAEAIASIGKDKWDSMDLAAKRTAIRDAIQSHKFVTTALPKYYPDPATAAFPRTGVKAVVFKVFKDGGRAYMDMITPEDM